MSAAVVAGSSTAHFETLEQSLQACDSEKNFAGIQKAFQRHVQPRLESLLRTTLKAPMDPSVAPAASAHESINAARRVISMCDDVKYLVMRSVAEIVKAANASDVTTRASPADARRGKRLTRGEDMETLLCNVFCLLYGIKLTNGKTDADAVTLRWSVLASEKKTLEKSEAYANSNAAERRAMQLKTVLAVFSDRGRRHEFSAVWTAFTSAELPSALRVHFLTSANSHIMPFLTKPVALSDFLSTSVAEGGLLAVLALDGLLHLMMHEGLEYPAFYDKLYSLITADSFSTKHRHQLFNLVNLALTSSRVSAEIVAAFIKRIARVLLLAPAPSLYFSLPFLRQLFQRHPNCVSLIHRIDGAESLFDGNDPFDPFASKPSESHALESTLWELCILERHFLPAVGLMVSAYASPAQDQGVLKLDKTYGRIFAQEVTRSKNGDVGVLAYKGPEAGLLAPGHKEIGLAGVFTA